MVRGRAVNVSTFLALVTVSLAAYRVTRVVVADSISDPFRAWVWNRAYTANGGWDSLKDAPSVVVRSRAWRWAYDGLSCSFCVGWWVTLCLWWGYMFGPEWFERCVEALAAVGVQAFVSSRKDA